MVGNGERLQGSITNNHREQTILPVRANCEFPTPEVELATETGTTTNSRGTDPLLAYSDAKSWSASVSTIIGHVTLVITHNQQAVMLQNGSVTANSYYHWSCYTACSFLSQKRCQITKRTPLIFALASALILVALKNGHVGPHGGVTGDRGPWILLTPLVNQNDRPCWAIMIGLDMNHYPYQLTIISFNLPLFAIKQS